MLLRILVKKIINKWRSCWKRFFGYPVILNANKTNEITYSKRALLIYLVDAFIIDSNDNTFLRHQNVRQCRQIAAVLDDAGYIVDVVDYRDDKFVPFKAYDLVISHRVKHPYNEDMFGSNTYKVYFPCAMCHKALPVILL